MIGALVTALAQGRGGVLVIEGPPGIGKSRLLTEVMAIADKAGVRTPVRGGLRVPADGPVVLTVHGHPGRRTPVGAADALRQLGGSADLPYWVVHDLADAIHAAAAQTPLAIVLEDIHWNVAGPIATLAHAVGVSAAVGVPIIVDGRVWGLAAVGSLQHGPMRSDTEVRISQFAELTATALVAGYRDEQTRPIHRQ